MSGRTGRVTTLPVPITDLSPIVAPGHMIAPPPINDAGNVIQTHEHKLGKTDRKH